MSYSTSATRVTATSFRPYKGKVFVTDIERGDKLTKGGLIILDDNMTNRGIRARWARVWAVADDVQDIAVGDWVLVEHGRWTNRISMDLNGIETDVWRIDYPEAALIVSDVEPDSQSLPDSKKEFGVAPKRW